MAKKSENPVAPVVGRKYGKIDLDRIGFFDDGVSGPFDKYKYPAVNSKEKISKGGQIQAGPRIELFEKKFQRILSGEALSEPWRLESKRRVLERKKNLGTREFQLVGPAKNHSTPNDFFGCFGSPNSLDHSPQNNKTKKTDTINPPNFKIKPNPIGGPGYVDICLSPYPKHDKFDPYETKKNTVEIIKERGARFLTTSMPQEYFPPNPYKSTSIGPTYVRLKDSKELPMIPPGKIYVPGPKKIGGCKAGCFDKFPQYESSPYDAIRSIKNRFDDGKGRWLGGYPNKKDKYTRSIIDYGTTISCNANNYPDYREQIYPLNF